MCCQTEENLQTRLNYMQLQMSILDTRLWTAEKTIEELTEALRQAEVMASEC